MRMSLDEADLSEYDGLAVRVLGDGKRYRLRLRSEDRSDAVAYQATFDTAGDVWQVVEIPFASFLPTFRGRTPRDAPPLDISKIRQIGFMIADKQEGLPTGREPRPGSRGRRETPKPIQEESESSRSGAVTPSQTATCRQEANPTHALVYR